MLDTGDGVLEHHQAPFTANPAIHHRFHGPYDQCLAGAPIGDQIGDRPDFQAMFFGKADQVRKARHLAVILHDLADHAGRFGDTRRTGDVDNGLGMACTNQRTAVTRHQRKDMARCRNVLGVALRVDRGAHSMGTVRC